MECSLKTQNEKPNFWPCQKCDLASLNKLLVHYWGAFMSIIYIIN